MTEILIGIISGIVDSLFVGETEIDKDKIQELLENKYHTANDSGYKHKDADGHWTSSAMYHRLDDLARVYNKVCKLEKVAYTLFNLR